MNPFRATLGSTPPYLAGRQEQISQFSDALEDGPGSHERISLIAGLRGAGKTVLLNAFEDEARARSWWVVSETATSGFTKRIIDSLFEKAGELLAPRKKHVSAIHVAHVGGLEFDEVSKHQSQVTLRSVLTELLTKQREIDRNMNQASVGVLITLDELHLNRRDEIIDFGTTIQHLVREDLNIAVAMAGIPQAVKPLLASQEGTNPVTFLRRANRIELGSISDTEVRRALEEPVIAQGCEWDADALHAAVHACGGYPFMVQLVGQQCFRRREGSRITSASVHVAVDEARRKLGQLVHEPALEDLSEVDRTFLVAMAVDDGPSKMIDIAQRLGVTPQYAGTYRRRLIEAETITSVGYGLVDFALPYMREYLRTHAVVEVFDSKDTKD